jgi:hypothetical protein
MVAREPVAQPVEHLTFNQGVKGSNPFGLTNYCKYLALKSPSLWPEPEAPQLPYSHQGAGVSLSAGVGFGPRRPHAGPFRLRESFEGMGGHVRGSRADE